jgi:uncharacterized protein (DUF1501 family)
MKDSTMNTSRRHFLRQAGAVSGLVGSAAAPLAINLMAAGSAAAQSATDYKALVCLFLGGGNDGFNTVVATDPASFANYTAVRHQAPDSIALLAPGTPADPGASWGSPKRLGGVLPITPMNAQGRSFALHPLLGGLQSMFNADRRLAVLANVGPLVMPTTKAQVALGSHPKPSRLFSHNDQQNTWQAMAPEGATLGWGGRMGDLLASMNSQPIFTSVSTTGNAVWLAGRNIGQYQVTPDGAIRMAGDYKGRVFGSYAVAASLERIVAGSRGTHPFEADLAAISRRSVDAETVLRSALRPATDPAFGTAPSSGVYKAQNDPKLQYTSPSNGAAAFNPVAHQFQIVARMVQAGLAQTSGVRRQVFFVSLPGFDTHDAQNRGHADLMARLTHALRYFDTALGAIGGRSQVTTFTASDFGRTFTSNGDGTDHGWGAHHFVLGGAVRGGNLYGRFPVLGAKNAGNNGFDSSPDQIGNGALLPTTSVDQYGATLGRWFGLSDASLLDIFPNLANFDASQRNLGFMNV